MSALPHGERHVRSPLGDVIGVRQPALLGEAGGGACHLVGALRGALVLGRAGANQRGAYQLDAGGDGVVDDDHRCTFLPQGQNQRTHPQRAGLVAGIVAARAGDNAAHTKENPRRRCERGLGWATRLWPCGSS